MHHSYKIEKVYTISLNVKFLFYIGIQQTFSHAVTFYRLCSASYLL